MRPGQAAGTWNGHRSPEDKVHCKCDEGGPARHEPDRPLERGLRYVCEALDDHGRHSRLVQRLGKARQVTVSAALIIKTSLQLRGGRVVPKQL